MEIQKDFRDLLALFNGYDVKYLIIGGYALAFHGAPRYTGDLDIFVMPSPENAQQVLEALKDFGFGAVGLVEDDFKIFNNVVQLGVPPVRIDIVTSITGVSWDEAFSNRVKGNYGDITVYYIGRDQFIANKRSIGRKKDAADLEALCEE